MERIYRPFLESFLPKPHYLEGETIQRVIRMAPYRAQVPKTLGVLGMILLILSLVGLLITFLIHSDAGEMLASGGAVIGLLLLFESAQDWLSYNQWQFILTDKRIILVTPDPDRKGFADAIYLKQGKIQVLDTNYSKSPIWGLFQILKGSRDVMLSMGGYEFYEQGAKVKGGLRFPDVASDDISHLEKLIFG
ncbi:MAG: hypothetical protein JXA33_25810 [Anaerolineae bacterium]|nr:hypothetical protein [Anaerolineae bacterium]